MGAFSPSNKEALRMKILLSLMAALILFVNSYQAAHAVGPTNVKDPISVSTVWTKDNSPYIIQNDITVARGAILSIEPGVEVRLTSSAKGSNLIVQGGLRAVGNSQSPISFLPVAQGAFWGAIYFQNSDTANCVLQGCLIKGGSVVCYGSSPTIAQCAIYGSKCAIEVAANSQPQITGNRITANSYGIYLFADSASPVISNNEIYNNTYGFYIKDFGTPVISGNKIYSNVKLNVLNYTAKSLSAPNNDFRSTDAQLIAKTIYDGAFDARLGRFNFMPYVGMPSGQGAPVVANAAQAEKPKVSEDEFWSYGRPFDAMKISNVDNDKKKPSNTVKILAVGATAVVTAVLLFL
jgi:parallel beta-helix repeat protein